MNSKRYKWDNAGGVLPSECGEYVAFEDYDRLRTALVNIYQYDTKDNAEDILHIAGVALGLEKEEL